MSDTAIDFKDAEATVLGAEIKELIELAVATVVVGAELAEKYGYDEGKLPKDLYDYIARIEEVAKLYKTSK